MARPWQSYEEYQVDQALTTATSDPETIRNTRWRGAPPLFRDHAGIQRADASIGDILDINRYGASNASQLSGFPVRRTGLTDDSWTGSSRYSMETLG